MNTITLQAPKTLGHWLRIYKLYRSAFPKEERKPFSIIVNKYLQGIFDVWCICRGGKFSGIATTINHGDLILIDYLAVSPACRSQGIGSAALRLLKEKYDGKDLLLEIESVYEDHPEKAQRLRRKAFYLSCGMKPMEVMVDLFGVPMELMSFGKTVTFQEYLRIYTDATGQWIASHIQSLPYPQQP